MKIEIKNRFTSEIIFSCEAESMKAAVKLAVDAKANLSQATLVWADLSGTNLSGVNLSGVNLSRANLSGANLSGANLSGTNLSGANLSEANLSGANLTGASLDYSAIPMWCGTLENVEVDFGLVCQMLLHVFALRCNDKRFLTVKKVIGEFAKLSTKWRYYERKDEKI
jgi:hypothetical protein